MLRMGATRLAYTSCSSISPAVRSPMMPIVPVAQNVHPIAHPTCSHGRHVAAAKSRVSPHVRRYITELLVLPATRSWAQGAAKGVHRVVKMTWSASEEWVEELHYLRRDAECGTLVAVRHPFSIGLRPESAVVSRRERHGDADSYTFVRSFVRSYTFVHGCKEGIELTVPYYS
eukprot:5095262-Pyramimonas_sp.AAC.1